MALLKLGGRKKGKKHEIALRLIGEIKDHPGPLQVEIEHTAFHFYSKSTVRAGSFVLTIPTSIQGHLEDGGWVRIILGNGAQEDLRIQVSNQERLEIGKSAKIFCRLPSATVEPKRRSEVRSFTGDFNNLLVDLGQLGSFPILDFSGKGIRIQSGIHGVSLTPGKPIEGGKTIRMGTRIIVPLNSLVPRFQFQQWMGLEFSVKENRSGKILAVFLESLDQKIREASFEENV